ncbi:hypothetical protein CPC08DRAFT_801825 [Agrocybe pediades]|nr:hypothetical protein CPC08DRAFT_801825 [Agrocybe pediades]
MHLNDDPLLLTFNTIATSRDNPVGVRQATIRHASQVCQGWRALFLSASYIWGRLIWINRVQKEDWMKRVLERAKTTSLLSAVLDGEGRPWSAKPERIFYSLAISFLQTAWESLEEMHISYRSSISQLARKFNREIWEQIANPAPNLRSFAIRESGGDEDMYINPLPVTSTVDMVSGRAPLLQDFTCIPYRIPHPDSRWLSRITSLRRFHASFYGGNRRCRLLCAETPGIATRQGPWGGSSRFISPAESYSSIFISLHETDITEEPQRLRLLDALSNFFYHHAGITTSNGCTDYIVIQVHAPSNPELYMKLSFHLKGGDYDYKETARFFAHAIMDYAHCTTHLHLFFRRKHRVRNYMRAKVFDSLLLSMHDVESITLGYKSLEYYDGLEEKKGKQLFTKLKTVTYVPEATHVATRVEDGPLHQLLKAFLMRRVQAGRPVSTLHLEDPENNEDKVCKVLHEVSGLQVSWGTGGKDMLYRDGPITSNDIMTILHASKEVGCEEEEGKYSENILKRCKLVATSERYGCIGNDGCWEVAGGLQWVYLILGTRQGVVNPIRLLAYERNRGGNLTISSLYFLYHPGLSRLSSSSPTSPTPLTDSPPSTKLWPDPAKHRKLPYYQFVQRRRMSAEQEAGVKDVETTTQMKRGRRRLTMAGMVYATLTRSAFRILHHIHGNRKKVEQGSQGWGVPRHFSRPVPTATTIQPSEETGDSVRRIMLASKRDRRIRFSNLAVLFDMGGGCARGDIKVKKRHRSSLVGWGYMRVAELLAIRRHCEPPAGRKFRKVPAWQ